ncbi:MAG: hypothetical protein IJ374_03215 [Lachnospiraceae bacterium]|nr:hypothetical protein [Lachnospiraceae bacterium]
MTQQAEANKKKCYMSIDLKSFYASTECRERILTITRENIRAFLAGKPQNVVNP